MLHMQFLVLSRVRPGVIGIAVVLLLLFAVSPAGAAGPYYVATYDDLCKVGTEVDGWTLDADYIQTANIYCPDGVNFTPIGNTLDLNGVSFFSGTYDGQNYKIENLHIYDNGYSDDVYYYPISCIALFAATSETAEIKNVYLKACNVTGLYYVGGLVGSNRGNITNCDVEGNITGQGPIGGIVGTHGTGYSQNGVNYPANYYALIKDSNFGGMVRVYTVANHYAAGGIAGRNSADIDSCTSSGVVGDKSLVAGLVGGIVGSSVGYIEATITNCISFADVYGSGALGGVVGNVGSAATFKNCAAYGNVTGNPIYTSSGWWPISGQFIGGFMGRVQDLEEWMPGFNVVECAAYGDVSGGHCAGFMGGCYSDYNIQGLVLNSLAAGTVTTTYCPISSGYVRPRIGAFSESSWQNPLYKIEKSYAVGNLVVDSPNMPQYELDTPGGVSGFMVFTTPGPGINTSGLDCFFDTQTTGREAGGGLSQGKTTAQMYDINTYTNWSIATPETHTDEVWIINDGYDYPYLANLPYRLSPLPRAEVTVSVKDGETHGLIAGAQVTQIGTPNTTYGLANGMTAFTLKRGEYAFMASAPGYNASAVYPLLVDSSTEDLVIYLNKIPPPIKYVPLIVQVNDQHSNPIFEAEVIVSGVPTGFSNATGAVQFNVIANQNYVVKALKPGYQTSETIVPVQESSIHVTLTLKPDVPETQTTTSTPAITPSGVSGPLPVRFVVQSYAGQPLANVTVTATPLESTGPLSWLYDLFGVSGDADINGTVLSGSTDTGGGIVLPLIRTVKYRVAVTDLSRGIDTAITIYPQEDAVVLTVWPQEPPGPANDFQLYAGEEGRDIRVGVRYATADLDRITFTVTTEAGEIVYTAVSVAQGDDLPYLLDGEPGEVYLYGYVAEFETGEVVRQDQFIRFSPESRPWIDLAPWIPLAAYHWASVFILVGFAMTFVRGEIRGALLTIPILAGTLWLIGWFQVPWLLVGAVLVIGVLVYMRMGESDLGF